jgi:DNA gyrase subunit B
LHGVGVSVVNALSTRLDVEIWKDGYVWRQSYEMSQPVTPLTRGEETDETGTIITFWPDGSIFETTEWSFETLSRRMQEMAFLNRGLSITMTDERPEHITPDAPSAGNYHYDGGIADFDSYLNATTETVHEVASPARSPCSGPVPMPSPSTPSPTRSTRPRAARTRRGSARR